MSPSDPNGLCGRPAEAGASTNQYVVSWLIKFQVSGFRFQVTIALSREAFLDLDLTQPGLQGDVRKRRYAGRSPALRIGASPLLVAAGIVTPGSAWPWSLAFAGIDG